MQQMSIDRPFGLMFHHFHGTHHAPSQGSIDADMTADLIRWLQRRYRLLPAQEWLDRALSDQLGTRDICLTFDDNLRCQYDVALPVLKHFDITAFWFIYTSPLEGKVEKLELYRHFRHTAFPDIDTFYDAFFTSLAILPETAKAIKALNTAAAETYLLEFPFYSTNDRRFRYLRDIALPKADFDAVMMHMITTRGYGINDLRDMLWMDQTALLDLQGHGHILGLHSHSHPTRLDLLSEEEQDAEYRQNKMILSACLGLDIKTMSHPCNAFTSHTIETLKTIGIQIGFRADMNPSTTPHHDYPRLDHVIAREMMK